MARADDVRRWAVLGAVVVVMGLVPWPAAAYTTKLAAFEQRLCWQQPEYLQQGSVRFAPVEPIPAHARRPGFGTYQLRGDGYPGGKYRRERDGLTFVSALHPPKDNRLPTHLWHVISLPRVPKHWDGLIANHQAMLASNFISQNDPAMRSKTRWYEESTKKEYLVYNLAPAADHSLVTARWRELVGAAIMTQLIETSVGYDHHFYYVPLPARSAIRPGGWLHPSRRTINRPGLAYGFVLDDRGDCVGATSINVE